MNYWVSFLLGVQILSSCLASRPHAPLAKFSLNNKFHNSLIVNRVPHYGDGNPDGCIVNGGIYLSLTSLNQAQISGEITDVKTLGPLPNAQLKVFFKSQKEPVTLSADSEGKVKFDQDSGVNRLEVNYIGYRPLVIEFKAKDNLL